MTTTTLKPGTVVEVRPQGFVNGVLVAKGPAGDPGPKGDRGDAGPQGDPGPKGDKGDTGSTGLTGPANTLAVGTVTTSSPGGSADATVTGSAPNQTLNLTIPRGVQGPQGDPGPKGDPGTGNVDTVNGKVGPDITLNASDVGARPDTYVPDWTEVTGKPSTFAPSAHTHAESEITGLTADLAAKIATSSKGVANGVASLDSAGKVPVAQLPAGMMQLKGSWNASTNTPTLADGSGAVGAYYRVSTAGTQNLGSGSQTFGLGDFVIYNDLNQWELSHSGSDLVQSVAGLTGTITPAGLKTALAIAQSDVSGLTTALSGKQDTSAKGAANGYAGLGADGKVPAAQLPTTSSATGPLVRVSYAPASTVSTPAGTSVAAVDSTNLAISFTAPSSGKVRVALECGWISAASAFYYWSLLAGGSNLSGSERALDLGTGTTPSARTRIEIAISGLTSGTSYTYTWAHRASAASGGTIRYGGSSSEFTSTNYGPAIMEVYAE